MWLGRPALGYDLPIFFDFHGRDRVFIAQEMMVLMKQEVWAARSPAGYFKVSLDVQYSLPSIQPLVHGLIQGGFEPSVT
jgi:hypothetical protein